MRRHKDNAASEVELILAGAAASGTDPTVTIRADKVLGPEHEAPGGDPRRRHVPSIVAGVLAGVQNGRVLVKYGGSGGPVVAVSAIPLAALPEIGSSIALMFDGGDRRRPILIGVMSDPEAGNESLGRDPGPKVEAKVDGRRVVLSAEDEIELSCGKASITLTRAGKIMIRGTYVLSRSSGPNRIKGGSVQIN